MDDLQYYRHKGTGKKFFLFGFANYITGSPDGAVKNIVIFHPENDPHALWTMDSRLFNTLYTKWKDKS